MACGAERSCGGALQALDERDGVADGGDALEVRVGDLDCDAHRASAPLQAILGQGAQVARLSGQNTVNARPTMESSVIVDLVMSPVSSQCSRESPEADRWSPITQSRPGGTVMLIRQPFAKLIGDAPTGDV